MNEIINRNCSLFEIKIEENEDIPTYQFAKLERILFDRGDHRNFYNEFANATFYIEMPLVKYKILKTLSILHFDIVYLTCGQIDRYDSNLVIISFRECKVFEESIGNPIASPYLEQAETVSITVGYEGRIKIFIDRILELNE